MEVKPKIFFFWDKKLTDVQYSIDRCRRINKNFEIVLFNNKTGAELIRQYDVGLHQIYTKIRIPACRADIVRLVALYLHGGIWCDVKIQAQKNFMPLYNRFKNTELVMLLRKGRRPNSNEKYMQRANGMLIGKRKSVLIQNIIKCIKNGLNRCCPQPGKYKMYNLTGVPAYRPISKIIAFPFISEGFVIHTRHKLNIPQNNRHWSKVQEKEPLFLDRFMKMPNHSQPIQQSK